MEQSLPSKEALPRTDSESGIRYVLSGQPTGWAAMASQVRDFDEEKVKDTKEDIDTLLVFVRGFCSTLLVAHVVMSHFRRAYSQRC